MASVWPMEFYREGDVLRPVRPRAFAQQYAEGEIHRLAPVEERSHASHAHFFAALTEAWRSLPEAQAERFPSAEHMRKWALIRAGYRDDTTVVAASPEEAQRIAALARSLDGYAVIVVRDDIVTVMTAKSQSQKAMGKADFQASKDAVLGIVAGLIGTTTDELAAAGRSAA
jgi:hypothetical protein